MVRKVVKTIVNVVCVLLIVFSVIALLTVLFARNGRAPKMLGFSAFRVLTGSMEPTYPIDCMVLVKEVDPSEIKEGDVISFYSQAEEIQGSINTHRVIGVYDIDGKKCFETKGDANPAPDDVLVSEEYVIGEVVGSSMLFGKIVHLTSNPLIFGVFIIIPIFVIMIMNIVQAVRTAKELQKEETEKMLRERENQTMAPSNHKDETIDPDALRAEIDRIKAEIREKESSSEEK